MIKLKKLVSEAPVDVHQTIGDFSKGHSFTKKADRALVTNPTAVQKVRNFFKNTDVDFDFYFVNTKEARGHVELGRVKPDFIFDTLKIKPEQLQGGRINPDHITVFFTNNQGAERAPLTPWIIAHRLGHVLRREWAWDDHLQRFVNEKIRGIMDAYGHAAKTYIRGHDSKDVRRYEIAMRYLLEHIGTFKSARDHNLREPFEFHYELFAQWLKDGRISFNPLPDRLYTGRYGYYTMGFINAGAKEDAEENLNSLALDYRWYANDVLSGAIGNIYLM